MRPAEALAETLAERGITARVTGWKSLVVEIPDLPEGVSVRTSRDRFASRIPEDPFHGWRFRYRVAKEYTRQAPELRRMAALKTWEALKAAGFLFEDPPKEAEEIAMPGEE